MCWNQSYGTATKDKCFQGAEHQFEEGLRKFCAVPQIPPLLCPSSVIQTALDQRTNPTGFIIIFPFFKWKGCREAAGLCSGWFGELQDAASLQQIQMASPRRAGSPPAPSRATAPPAPSRTQLWSQKPGVQGSALHKHTCMHAVLYLLAAWMGCLGTTTITDANIPSCSVICLQVSKVCKGFGCLAGLALTQPRSMLHS